MMVLAYGKWTSSSARVKGDCAGTTRVQGTAQAITNTDST